VKKLSQHLPTIEGLSSLDAAVLMEKMIILNGMLAHGTKEENEVAKVEWEKLEKLIAQYINLEAIEEAKLELGFAVEDIENCKFNSFF
jgi:hypothetical protein